MIQASLPTTHFYTSLHAALPVPEAWLAPGIHQASQGQGHVFSLRSSLAFYLPFFLLSDSPGPAVCFRLNS